MGQYTYSSHGIPSDPPPLTEMEDSQCIERNCSAFQVKTLKGRSNGLPASVAAESLTNVSLEQAFQKGLQLRGEDVWKFHILGVGGGGRIRSQKCIQGNSALTPDQI